MMQLVVPMAGLGRRFAEAGYTLPKPLIPVSGVPMVVRVVADLPPARPVVFVVHQDHVRRFGIEVELPRYIPGCRVVVAPGLTAGQACTVRLASDAIDLDGEALVAACDATHVYDPRRFDALRGDPSIAAIAWTYRGHPHVLASPTSYGWARVAAGGIDLVETSCKRTISDRPLGDHVLSGFFWFRRAGEMFDSIDQLVADGRRTNGEFYMDDVPNLFVSAGRRVVVFEVDKHIGWGTPDDLRDYQRWESYFARHRTPRGGGTAWPCGTMRQSDVITQPPAMV